jgi:hypothetical protein
VLPVLGDLLDLAGRYQRRPDDAKVGSEQHRDQNIEVAELKPSDSASIRECFGVASRRALISYFRPWTSVPSKPVFDLPESFSSSAFATRCSA